MQRRQLYSGVGNENRLDNHTEPLRCFHDTINSVLMGLKQLRSKHYEYIVNKLREFLTSVSAYRKNTFSMAAETLGQSDSVSDLIHDSPGIILTKCHAANAMTLAAELVHCPLHLKAQIAVHTRPVSIPNKPFTIGPNG